MTVHQAPGLNTKLLYTMQKAWERGKTDDYKLAVSKAINVASGKFFIMHSFTLFVKKDGGGNGDILICAME